jgi:hypothetical protein
VAFLASFLKLVAPVFVLVGALHLVLGVGADALLGARLPAEAFTDPALNSQNRFYGVAFCQATSGTDPPGRHPEVTPGC